MSGVFNMLSFSTTVDSKRIPEVPDDESTAALLSSQEASLKSTGSLSQSQSQPEEEPAITPFILTRTHSTFFASSSSSSSSSEPTAKRHKAFHTANDAKDEKEEKKAETISPPPLANPVSKAQPLLECVERHLTQIQTDTDSEKKMVARFLYKLAEACRDKSVTDAAYAPRKFKRRKETTDAKPKDPKKIAAQQAKRLAKARAADKQHLDNIIRDCITAAAALGYRKAQLTLQKYQLKEAQKPTRRQKEPLPSADVLFTSNPPSYLPALRKFMKKNAADLDLYYPPKKVQAMVRSLIAFADNYFYEYRNSLLPSSSLSLRR
jgi:hypothetical protein